VNDVYIARFQRGLPAAESQSISFSNLRFLRADGQVDTGGNLPNPNPIQDVIIPAPFGDGFVPASFDPNVLNPISDKLSNLQNSVDELSDLRELIKASQANNGVTPYARNRTPQAPSIPVIEPDAKPKPTDNYRRNPAYASPAFVAKPYVSGVSDPKDYGKAIDEATGLSYEDWIKKNRADYDKLTQPLPRVNPKIEVSPIGKTTTASSSITTAIDRFKPSSDCKFSCENLAACFVDLEVDVFDGCDETTGKAKTKKITIQVLPKDKVKTSASFKELLDIRGRECSLLGTVVTIPDYWQTRVNQRPQAVVVYREFLNGKFTDTYYSQSIPHYNKPKGVKPSLTQWSKGEHMFWMYSKSCSTARLSKFCTRRHIHLW